MRLPLILLPEAEAELGEAMLWYEERRAGLGHEFLGCVRRVLVSHTRRRPGYWLGRRS